MAHNYNHKAVEEKWMGEWARVGLFQNTAGYKGEHMGSPLQKLYLLFAFAYPSGSGLHVGHVESKTALDILARFSRMRGKEVFFPVGWDAFGLPAENYAVKTGIPPAVTTKNAIEAFRQQVKRIGISYDFAAEIATNHPEYYKWTQWLFLQLYNKGLAYKAMGKVNWCPSCMTVLANEQVIQKSQDTITKKQTNSKDQFTIDQTSVVSVCERCETPVVQKDLEQWYFKITKYADELVSGLDQVDWPAPTKHQQLNWIGRSEGLKETWKVKDLDLTIDTFTTWPHTTWGATFIVVAPEHPVVAQLVEGTIREKEVLAFCQEIINEKAGGARQEDKEKKGIFTGRCAINPLTGWEMPIYVANFAIMNYGTGIVKGCPAHDERDFEFALKYDLPRVKVIDFGSEFHSIVIKQSVRGGFIEEIKKLGWYTMEYQDWGYGVVVPAGNEDKYINIVQDYLIEGPWYVHTDGSMKKVIYKQQTFSIADDNDKAKQFGMELGIPEERLDWDGKFNYSFCYPGQGVMVNAGDLTGMNTEEASERIMVQAVQKGYGQRMITYKLRDWLISRQRYWGAPIPIVYDPEGKPHPVKDGHLPWLLPTDVEFKPTGESPLVNSVEFKERVERLYGPGWRPEYDTMDTFVDSSWYYLRYPSARSEQVAFEKDKLEKWLPVDFYMIGPEHIVLHLLYSRFLTKFLRDEGYLAFDEPFMKMRHQGMILGPDHKKMSKSKGNVITPDEIIAEFGADTLRMYEMFMGPIEADKPWDPRAVSGVNRLLKRIWNLVTMPVGANNYLPLHQKLHETLQRVTRDIPELKFNTAIAAMFELVNAAETAAEKLDDNDKKILVKMLAPLAPYMAEEMWHELGGEFSVHQQAWPELDEAIIANKPVILVVQVNGKVRSTIEILDSRSQILENELLMMARADERVRKWVEGKEIKKTIYVEPKNGRQGIINLIVA